MKDLTKALFDIRDQHYSGQLEPSAHAGIDVALIDLLNTIIKDYQRVKKGSLDFKTALMEDIDILSEALEKISKDNLEISLPDVQLIEMGNIQVGILDMTDALRDYRKRVEEYSKTLEMKVEERTKELKTARDLAEEATRSKSEFLANMSHEIRTPLNAIMGLSSLALRTRLTEKQLDYLTKIEESARNLLGIINDILDFSKIEAGKLIMEASDFDLYDVMDSLTNLFSAKSVEKGVEMIVSIAPDVPRFLVGDSLRLGQVLINLASNALKFTDSGEVVVKVELLEKTGRQATLKFSVRDTGIGIEPEKLPNLFLAFTQADGSTTRQYGGTGLGLAICKRIVEMMDGQIWAESQKDVGSCFQFSAVFDRQLAEKTGPSMLPTDLHNLRTLVVEDNEAARLILAEILNSFRFDVSTACSGSEALKKIAHATADTAYELILMDWKLPDLDGIETIKRIRQENQYAHIPIILMTAFGREELIANAQKAGANAFLIKPLKQSLLFDTIMDVLGRGEAMPRKKERHRIEPRQIAENIRGAHVLLVEDNAINQQVAIELLQNSGIIVSVANNGKEALSMFNHHAYDAILMDVQMPIMDGFAATRAIRDIESTAFSKQDSAMPTVSAHSGGNQSRPSETPIIAMTAHAMKGDREKCIAEGMNDYITKPIDVESLFDTLSRWIRHDGNRTVSGSLPPTNEAPSETVDFPEQLPGIDIQSALRRLNHDKRLFKKLLLEFKREYTDVANNIRDALRTGVTEVAQRLAHTIKGIAGNFSAQALMRISGDLELGIREGKITATDSLIDDFECEMQVILEAATNVADVPHQTPLSGMMSMASSQLSPQLNELAGLLRNQDLDAEECFENIKQNMGDSNYQQELKTLENRIGKLDFDGAQTALIALAKKMDITVEKK